VDIIGKRSIVDWDAHGGWTLAMLRIGTSEKDD
jgi:hypothetical protein